MVTGYILHLTIDTFLDVAVKNDFPLLSVDWYLLSGNRYLPRGSNKNALCVTSTDNVSVARWVIPLVTIPLLDLAMNHWIPWIQGNSFRKNSIVIKTVTRPCQGIHRCASLSKCREHKNWSLLGVVDSSLGGVERLEGTMGSFAVLLMITSDTVLGYC